MPQSSSPTKRQAVLVIYTGGTIGSIPRDRTDPLSSLAPAALEDVLAMLPRYDASTGMILLGRIAVPLKTLSWDPPIDSSTITFDHWARLAREIMARYADHVGFVVLHGTDTLAYTASALAFMLDDLTKPVVLTGSQRPIGETRSDAVQNLVTAIEIAAASLLGETVVPEVCIFFRDELLRGCRTTKVSASSYSAFSSPNYPPLGTAGEFVAIDQSHCRRPALKAATIHDRLESGIASLDIFPGMRHELLRALLSTGDLRGVVLKTFGTGNIPATPEFLKVIGEAVERGVVVVNVTQCVSGEVSLGLYEASAGLLARGVVGGMDITAEAALTKLAVVLGQERDPEIAADLVQVDLRGEQRASRYFLHYGPGRLEPGQIAQFWPIRPMTLGAGYDSRRLEAAALLVAGLSGQDADFKAYLDAPAVSEETRETGHPRFLGRSQGKGRETVLFDATNPARAYVDGRKANAITFVNSGNVPIAWKRLDLALRIRS